MYRRENVQLWVAVVLLVLTRITPTTTRTPTPTNKPATHATLEHHNYTLPILLVRVNLTYPSVPADDPQLPSGVKGDEYKDENEKEGGGTFSSEAYEEQVHSDPFPPSTENSNTGEGIKKSVSGASVTRSHTTASRGTYEEGLLFNLFPSSKHKDTDKGSNTSASGAPFPNTSVEEVNATFTADNSPGGQGTKPNPEVLKYFGRLIADINAAEESSGGSGLYKILPVDEGGTISASEKSDMDSSSSSPGHYLLESEEAPSTVLYSFPFASHLQELASRNNASEFTLRGKLPEGLSDAPGKDLPITFESPESLISFGKSSGRKVGDEQTPSSQTAEERHSDHHHHETLPLKLHFRASINDSLNPEGSEDVLESSASHIGSAYFAHLPRPSLAGDHLTAALYQYDAAPSLVPETVPHYAFEYVVRDPLHGGLHGHTETRHGQDTHGRYFVLLPDGRLQTVTYIANERGYFPQVVYTGEAKPAFPVKPPLGAHKPFYQTLKPVYVKDKLVVPHAVLFKPKSAYVIKYGKHTTFHSSGVSLKPEYVTPAPLQPILKPTFSPGLTTPVPLLTTPATIVSPAPLHPILPVLPAGRYKHPPHPHLTTTLSPLISPRPHIITKSQPRLYPHPLTITTATTTSKPSLPSRLSSVAKVTHKLTPRPVLHTHEAKLSPHPSLVTTLKPTGSPLLPTIKSGFSPLSPHPHIVTTSSSSAIFPPPPTVASKSSFSPVLPTITIVSSDFSPSHPSVIHSLGPTVSPHRHVPSHPSLIATSQPKFSHRHPFIPSLYPHVTTTPRPTPFHPTIITTTLTPRPKPHPHLLHSSHDHHLHHPFFSASPPSSKLLHDSYSKKGFGRPSVTTTTTATIISPEPNPEPHNVFPIGVTDRPRRLATTTTKTTAKGGDKRILPTLKPKPIFPATESSSESLYSDHSRERYKEQVLVTTPPGFVDATLKGYSSPKSTDILEDSFLATMKTRDFRGSRQLFVTPPAAKESFDHHGAGHDEAAGSPGPESLTLPPAAPSIIASDAPQTTIPNYRETHDNTPEKPFSPSEPLSTVSEHTSKRPHTFSVQSSPSVPSSPEHSEPHKYSIDIRVKPAAYPAHGTLFRTASPPSSPDSHREVRQHSHHDTESYHSAQPDDTLSSAPVSFDPFLRDGSLLPDSNRLDEHLSHVPETFSSEATESHLLEPQAFDATDTSEQLPWRPLSVAAPLSSSSIYSASYRSPSSSSSLLYPYSPSSSSSVKRESAGRYHSLKDLEDRDASADQMPKEVSIRPDPKNSEEEEEEEDGFRHVPDEHSDAENEYVVRVEASVHGLPNAMVHLAPPRST